MRPAPAEPRRGRPAPRARTGGGEVDADPQRDVADIFLTPFLNLAAGLGDTQSPIGKISPLSSARGMKSMGGISPSRVYPADEGFKTDNLARREVHLRLVIEHELVQVERLAQIGLLRPASVGGAAARARRCLFPFPFPLKVLRSLRQFQLAGDHVGQLSSVRISSGAFQGWVHRGRWSILRGSFRRRSARERSQKKTMPRCLKRGDRTWLRG